MIAPRKKKFIKLIIMAWSVVLVITGSALPVFASVPTDDYGNFLPSSYSIKWAIFDLDSQSYKYVAVTSSVTSDGLTFVFPYNATGVQYVDMILYTPYTSTQNNYFINGFDIEGYLHYDSTNQNGFIPLTYATRYYIFSYDYTSSSEVNSYLLGSKDNPFSFVYAYDTLTAFQTIRIRFYVSIVSGTLTIHFDHFVVGAEDILNKIKLSDLENSTEDLDDSVEALETALPLPTFDASAFASAEAIADDYTFFNDGLRFSFMESDLVTHIFILVVYFTCLSIAIFGHAGG